MTEAKPCTWLRPTEDVNVQETMAFVEALDAHGENPATDDVMALVARSNFVPRSGAGARGDTG